MTNWQKIPLALTYDDVLLKPKRSRVESRRDVDLSTRLSRNLNLKIPVVAANMDTVTESNMAIGIAKIGGMGIIHRFLSINDQVDEVKKVKRWGRHMIDDPITVTPNALVSDTIQIMEVSGIGGIVVVDKDGKLAGIITRRDVQYEPNNGLVKQVMTPLSKLITAKITTSLEQAKIILHQHKIEKLPLINKDGMLQGLITMKDIDRMGRYPNANIDKNGRLMVGAAIGVGKDMIERARALVIADCDILVLDIAHGHLELAINAVKRLKKTFPKTELMAGNVATYEGVKDLVEAGANAIKVGVGPGSTCSTRIVTGCGVPQLTAVMDAFRYAKTKQIPINADGGIKTSGDVVKALAAGASSVMLGGMLAGCEESPGFTVIKNGRKFKVVRGMASLGANLGRDKREQKNSHEDEYTEFTPEGVEALSPYKGSVIEVLNNLMGGVRSGMSYIGAQTIGEMWKQAEFVRITQAGVTESHPHDVEVV